MYCRFSGSHCRHIQTIAGLWQVRRCSANIHGSQRRNNGHLRTLVREERLQRLRRLLLNVNILVAGQLQEALRDGRRVDGGSGGGGGPEDGRGGGRRAEEHREHAQQQLWIPRPGLAGKVVYASRAI